MNVTYEKKDTMTFIGYHTTIHNLRVRARSTKKK